MDVVQWGALGAFALFQIAFAGFLFRVADRLNRAEESANTASVTAAAAKLRADMLEGQLVEHRVNIAKEYVSRQALESLESKLIEAINRLGDRLDRLFQQHQ